MTTHQSESRLVLWDIDHTLLETRGLGKELYHSAFESTTGTALRCDVDVTGKTELAIFVETARRHGLDPDDHLVGRYRDELSRQYEAHTAALLQRGRPLPGAPQALAALAGHADTVQSVLTGNLQSVARTKLSVFRLDKYVDLTVGAYGDDERDRARLVPIAQRRASERYGIRFERRNTVIIGDSTSDVAAALAGGAAVVAVASGREDEAALRQAGALAVLPDLTDADRLRAAIFEIGS